MGGMDRLDWFLTRCLLFLICLAAVCALTVGTAFRYLAFNDASGAPFGPPGIGYRLDVSSDPDWRSRTVQLRLSARRVALPNGNSASLFCLRVGPQSCKHYGGLLRDARGLRLVRPGDPVLDAIDP
jgi:hypothetical protein